jgi:hypothetical protein
MSSFALANFVRWRAIRKFGEKARFRLDSWASRLVARGRLLDFQAGAGLDGCENHSKVLVFEPQNHELRLRLECQPVAGRLEEKS